MGTSKAHGAPGKASVRAKRDRQVFRVPRVREQLAPGLWQFEDDDGQLYLCVKAAGWLPQDRSEDAARRRFLDQIVPTSKRV